MKNLKNHIEDLNCLLQNKGYVGYFLSGGGYPGKLVESLTSFTASISKDQETDRNFSTSLTTYSYWKDEKSDSVQCRFAIDYDKAKGFRIKNVEVERLTRYGISAHKNTTLVTSTANIPEREQANALVALPALETRQKRKKGLKI